jgi:hypothetical protein
MDYDRSTSLAVRLAATSYVLDLSFAVAMPIALAKLARTGELPMTPWGFRAFSGPFERMGPTAFGILGLALMGVCAVETVAGVWLWQGRRRGATLGLAITPATLVLGTGFALPFMLGPLPVRTGIVLAALGRVR